MFSFLGNYSYDFPQPIPLTKRIRDYLEGVVDDRFYVSDKALKGFAKHAKSRKRKEIVFMQWLKMLMTYHLQ